MFYSFSFWILVWEQRANTTFLGKGNWACRAVTQSVPSYLQPRSHRSHRGVDVLCSDGAPVYAPFTGTIVRQAKPYVKENAINNGVLIAGRGKRWFLSLGHIQRCLMFIYWMHIPYIEVSYFFQNDKNLEHNGHMAPNQNSWCIFKNVPPLS